jgi:ABC-type Zn uptake system ZnuABC Zn-binding protein ZnuA
VFVDTVSNDRLARALARASGARIAPPLYTDALGPPDSPGGTYIGMMGHNAWVIAEALK